MLRSQYGVATSSSATPVSHAEDAQPNETIYKRRRGLPPQIGSTWKNNYRGTEIQRGSSSGPWTQYGIRGNSSWRGRGNFQSSRGHNSNQRHTGHPQRSTHHSQQSTHQVSVPPIATLPDIEYQQSSNSSSPSPQIKTSHPPSMSDLPVTRESPLPQAEAHCKTAPDEVHVPLFFASTFSEHQPVDDYQWFHRSRSPSPMLPPETLKRREIEHQPTHVSNLGQNEDLTISQSIKHYPRTVELMSSKANKPLLPGGHRRLEDSASIPALHPLEPLAQVQTEVVSPPILPATSSIKQELRIPSLVQSFPMERSLISSSCKFYPIPELCKKSYPDFKKRRKEFFSEKMQELSRLGLKRIKSFFRDDGLVIEWESKVPVWSDTLLPAFSDLASAIKRAHQINHLTSVKSSPKKRKRQSIDRHSRESSLKDNKPNIEASEPNQSERPRHSHENAHIQHWAAEIEMGESPTTQFRISSSLTPTSSPDHGNRQSTIAVPLLNTSELICFDSEIVPHNPHDAVLGAESLNTVIQQQKTSAMDVDTPTPTQLPKPMRRMLFKPVHPLRRSQPTSSVQDSILLASYPAKPLSPSLPAAEGHSKVDSQPQDDVPLQEKATPSHPRLPLPLPSLRCRHGPAQSHLSPIIQSSPIATQRISTPAPLKSRTPTPPTLHPWDNLIAEDMEVKQTRASSPKDEDHGDARDPDAELVVNFLHRGTPEEPNNHLFSRQEEIMEDLQLHAGHEGEDKDYKPSISTEEDMVAVEGLATKFLQRFLQLFDVDRLRLGAAYTKDALFSCRVHYVHEPSMAGLFATESGGSRPGFNVPVIQKGRAQIMNRLLGLGPHRFCPRGVPRTVNYDVVPLSSAAGGGILLTVLGEVVNPHLAGPQMDHILSVDQSFVLRRRRLEDEDDGMDRFGSHTVTNNLWPLVALSHQMTVRDVPPLQSEQMVSRIQGS